MKYITMLEIMSPKLKSVNSLYIIHTFSNICLDPGKKFVRINKVFRPLHKQVKIYGNKRASGNQTFYVSFLSQSAANYGKVVCYLQINETNPESKVNGDDMSDLPLISPWLPRIGDIKWYPRRDSEDSYKTTV